MSMRGTFSHSVVLTWIVFLFVSSGSARGAEIMVSETLRKVAEAHLSDLFDDWTKIGKELPAGTTKESSVAESMGKIKELLLVTPEQEADFRNGKFDDVGNKKRLGEVVVFYNKIRAMNIDIPSFGEATIKAAETGTLVGAKLEFAVRLNELIQKRLASAIEKKDDK